MSCVGILGFERLHTDGGDVLEASVDAADESTIPLADAAPDADLCAQLGAPDKPDADPGGNGTVLVALKQLDFGVDLDGGTPNIPGFNLDLACTTNLATSTCTSTELESTFDSFGADKSATGLDNAGFTLITYITKLSDLLAASTLNQGIQDGKYGGVFRMTGWNGTPNDSEVFVELFPALGIEPGDDGSTKPTFTVNDRWYLDERFQVAGLLDASRVKSDQAWVNGGQLVARFSTITFPITIDQDPKPFDILIQDAVMQGTVVTTNGLTNLTNVTVSGRWKTSDFLGQVRTIYVKNANNVVNKYLCNPDPNAQLVYGAVKANVCSARDIRSDGQDGKQQPCDAVSAALRMDGYAVTNRGDFDAGPAIDPRCTNSDDVPATDDCAPN